MTAEQAIGRHQEPARGMTSLTLKSCSCCYPFSYGMTDLYKTKITAATTVATSRERGDLTASKADSITLYRESDCPNEVALQRSAARQDVERIINCSKGVKLLYCRSNFTVTL